MEEDPGSSPCMRLGTSQTSIFSVPICSINRCSRRILGPKEFGKPWPLRSQLLRSFHRLTCIVGVLCKGVKQVSECTRGCLQRWGGGPAQLLFPRWGTSVWRPRGALGRSFIGGISEIHLFSDTRHLPSTLSSPRDILVFQKKKNVRWGIRC